MTTDAGPSDPAGTVGDGHLCHCDILLQLSCFEIASTTLLCRMDCIIGSEWISLFTDEHYWL